MPDQLVSDPEKNIEIRIVYSKDSGCREIYQRLPTKGCFDVAVDGEYGYQTRLGGFISGRAKIAPEANLKVYKDSSICGDSKISGTVEVHGNTLIRDTELASSNDKKIEINSFTPIAPLVISNAVIRGSVSVYGSTKIEGTPQNKITIDSLSQHARIEGNPRVFGNTSIYGQINIQENAEINNAQIDGGDVETPGILVLRIPGKVINATAKGYGYVQGLVSNDAIFDGKYMMTSVGYRFGHTGTTGSVSGVNSLQQGIIFNEGFIRGGCQARNMVGSYIAPFSGCENGAVLEGQVVIINGVFTGPLLRNQNFIDGQIKDN